MFAARSGGVMRKRKISARQVISDLHAGLSDHELMAKYKLTVDSLRYIFKRLVESGLMTELEFYQRMDLTESDVFRALSDDPHHVLNCPRCGRPLPEDGEECSYCQSVTLGR